MAVDVAELAERRWVRPWSRFERVVSEGHPSLLESTFNCAPRFPLHSSLVNMNITVKQSAQLASPASQLFASS